MFVPKFRPSFLSGSDNLHLVIFRCHLEADWRCVYTLSKTIEQLSWYIEPLIVELSYNLNVVLLIRSSWNYIYIVDCICRNAYTLLWMLWLFGSLLTYKIDGHQVARNASGGLEGLVNDGNFRITLAEVRQNGAVCIGFVPNFNRFSCSAVSFGNGLMFQRIFKCCLQHVIEVQHVTNCRFAIRILRSNPKHGVYCKPYENPKNP